jgi:ribonuclease HII
LAVQSNEVGFLDSPLWQFDRPLIQQYQLVAGVDEAGRGPLAGPLVAAAVIWRALPECECPVNDSKKLSAREREALYAIIVRDAAAWGVGIVTVKEINRRSMHQATFLAMQRALRALSLSPRLVLVDGLWTVPRIPLSQRAIVAGDGQSACIASASILAKVTRDRMMKDLDRRYPGYGFARHKGYATPEHLAALIRLGPCVAHRINFRRVRDQSCELFQTG